MTKKAIKNGINSDWTKILTALVGFALVTGGYRRDIDDNTELRKTIIPPVLIDVAVLKEQVGQIPEIKEMIEEIHDFFMPKVVSLKTDGEPEGL
jgi:hypothetical protein